MSSIADHLFLKKWRACVEKEGSQKGFRLFKKYIENKYNKELTILYVYVKGFDTDFGPLYISLYKEDYPAYFKASRRNISPFANYSECVRIPSLECLREGILDKIKSAVLTKQPFTIAIVDGCRLPLSIKDGNVYFINKCNEYLEGMRIAKAVAEEEFSYDYDRFRRDIVTHFRIILRDSYKNDISNQLFDLIGPNKYLKYKFIENRLRKESCSQILAGVSSAINRFKYKSKEIFIRESSARIEHLLQYLLDMGWIFWYDKPVVNRDVDSMKVDIDLKYSPSDKITTVSVSIPIGGLSEEYRGDFRIADSIGLLLGDGETGS